MFAVMGFLLVGGMVFGTDASTAHSAIADDLSESELEQQAARDAEARPRLFEYKANEKAARIEPFAFGANRPLFAGVDDTTIPAYLIDPTNSSTSTAFTGFEVWGAAYDSVNDRVLFNGGSTLYEWTSAGTVNPLGVVVDSGGTVQSMVGLAWHNGQLYGVKNIATEGIWQINTSTMVATLLFTYPSTHDFGGFAVDPGTGVFYATDDSTVTGSRALVRISNTGVVTAVAPYPAGETDIDGLAIDNNGRAYLVTDQPGQSYVYDLLGGTYLPPITNPWTTSEIFSGATWVPAAPSLASVSGRVVAPSGQGVGNAIVQIANGSSFNAFVRSNPFGYFSFSDVPTGATYTLTASGKGYTFAPMNVPVSSDVTGVTVSSTTEP